MISRPVLELCLYRHNVSPESRQIVRDYSNNLSMTKAFTSRAVALLQYGNISSWDTSHVTNMSKLFFNPRNAKSFQCFNDSIGEWDVSRVSDMSMFYMAYGFNQPLDPWDVGNVEDMTGMFCLANSFNQPLSNWDVRKVRSMTSLNEWDVSNVQEIMNMFEEASSFQTKHIMKLDLEHVEAVKRGFSSTMMLFGVSYW